MIERLRTFDRTPIPSRPWVETFVITLLALGLGLLADASDPLLIRGEFPWIWFGTVLLALRYGVLSGIASTLILVLAWYGLQFSGTVPAAEFPRVFFLGGMLLTLACGEYSASWRARIRRLEDISAYSSERMQSLTRAQYLLNLSHDRLERNLIFKPLTLRKAMQQLRSALAKATGDEQRNESAQVFLSILTQLCQLESASVHWTGLATSPNVAATIGDALPLDTDDPLVKFAEEKRTLCHVQQNAAEPGRYLVVAPLVSSNGILLGLLTVERMAFLAMNDETMQVMAGLVAYFADSVSLRQGTEEIYAAHPDCPPEFASELVRAARMQQEARIPSSLVSLTFDGHPKTSQIVGQLPGVGRGADVQWHMKSPEGNIVIMNLLLLAPEDAVSGYLMRLEAWLQKEFGLSFSDADIRHREVSCGVGNAVSLLKSVT